MQMQKLMAHKSSPPSDRLSDSNVSGANAARKCGRVKRAACELIMHTPHDTGNRLTHSFCHSFYSIFVIQGYFRYS